MSLEAYRTMLVNAVKCGAISAKQASKLFNTFLEQRLTKN